MSSFTPLIRQRLVWLAEDEPGIEDVRITHDGDSVTFSAVLVRLWEGIPLRASYELVCDAGWRVRELRMTAEREAADPHALVLLSDSAGGWRDDAGQPLPALGGCIDIDFRLTPLTNTLPIRRLALAVGQSREISVVYIAAPDLTVTPFRQRYTRLDDDGNRQRYRYESLASGYSTELLVDADGFVIEYPDAWRRIWPST